MHGTLRNIASTIRNSEDRAFLERHTKRFAQSLVRKYRSLGDEFSGHFRYDTQKQKLIVTLTHLLEDEVMEVDARMNIDVGLVHTGQGRRVSLSGEITQPGRADVCMDVKKVLNADPMLDTRKFMADLVKNHLISSDDAGQFLSDYDDLDENETPSKYARKWPPREKFVRMKFKHWRRAFVELKGHLYKTVDFNVNPAAGTFRLTLRAKPSFDGRHTTVEGTYRLNNWDPELGRPEGMTMTIGKMSVAREFEMPPSLETIDLALNDHHEDAIQHLSYILEKSGALHVTPLAESFAKAQRRERPTREERADLHRADRREQRRTTAKLTARIS